MTVSWQCVLVEYNPGAGTETETIVPVDQEQIELHEGATFVPVPKEWRNRLTTEQCLRKIYFGWRDTSTHAWVQDNELFGGYVIDTEHSRPEGGETLFGLYCKDYDILLDRTHIRGYPDDPLYEDAFAGTLVNREYHIPPAFGDPVVNGYPAGQDAATWIKGTPGGSIPDGILKTFFTAGVAIGTVSSVFSGLGAVFDQTARPTNTAILGHMEGLTVREALEIVLACFGLLQPAVKPWYGLRAKASSSKVVPEFFLLDLNTETTADWHFSDADTSHPYWQSGDAGGTVYSMFQDLRYRRSAGDLRTQVTVYGVGSSYKRTVDSGTDKLYQRVIGEWPTGDDVATYQDPYPTEFQRIPGWGGPAIITDIAGSSEAHPPHQIADQLANLIGVAMSKPSEMITGTTLVPVKKGQLAYFVDTTYGLDGLYPVLDVVGGGALRLYHVTAGYQPPTVQDLMSGPKMQLLKLALLNITRNTSGKGPNFYNPNVPGGGAPGRTSNSNQQNAVQSVTDTVAGLAPQGATNISKVTPDGMPIGDNADNYTASPLLDPPYRPTPGTDVFPTPRYVTRQAISPYAIMEWDDAVWGANHPYIWETEWDDIGVRTLAYRVPFILSSVEVLYEFDASNVRVIPPTATARILLEDAITHAMVPLDPPVDAAHPLFLRPEDNLAVQIELQDMAAGHTAVTLASEFDVDPRLFGFNS